MVFFTTSQMKELFTAMARRVQLKKMIMWDLTGQLCTHGRCQVMWDLSLIVTLTVLPGCIHRVLIQLKMFIQVK